MNLWGLQPNNDIGKNKFGCLVGKYLLYLFHFNYMFCAIFVKSNFLPTMPSWSYKRVLVSFLSQQILMNQNCIVLFTYPGNYGNRGKFGGNNCGKI